MGVGEILLWGVGIGFRVIVDDDDDDDDGGGGGGGDDDDDNNNNNVYVRKMGVRGGAVSWGTALQAGSSRVLFLMVSLEFFIDIIRPAHYGPGVDSAFNRNENQEYFLQIKAAGA